jgi:predicted DNA-binding protein (MmcQ/YjbR family)
MARPQQLRKRLLDYALSLPEAHLDHPWGEDVAKVNKKVFAFFGTPGTDEPGFGVKLPQSNAVALAQPGVTPTGYGLGKAGWVSIGLTSEMPFEMLREWIDESYRTIAAKRLSTPRVDQPRS